jgi:hypothetical protein
MSWREHIAGHDKYLQDVSESALGAAALLFVQFPVGADQQVTQEESGEDTRRDEALSVSTLLWPVALSKLGWLV